MNLARPKTVLQQLAQILADLTVIGQKLEQILANETQHSETHARIESRLDHVEQDIVSLKRVQERG
jgi:hypothetical protein